MKDLNNSGIDRQNMLNNQHVLENIQKKLGITGILFEGTYVFTTQMVMNFYGISKATIEKYTSEHQQELHHNGYQILKGEKLKDFENLFSHLLSDHDLIEENIRPDSLTEKTHQKLAVFDFRTFLNLGMLLKENEKARKLRNILLDLVIDSLHQKMGGSVNKYLADTIEEILEENRDFDQLTKDAKIKKDNIHERLKASITPITQQEYESFLSAKSAKLSERIINNPELLAVFKRLKDR